MTSHQQHEQQSFVPMWQWHNHSACGGEDALWGNVKCRKLACRRSWDSHHASWPCINIPGPPLISRSCWTETASNSTDADLDTANTIHCQAQSTPHLTAPYQPTSSQSLAMPMYLPLSGQTEDIWAFGGWANQWSLAYKRCSLMRPCQDF